MAGRRTGHWGRTAGTRSAAGRWEPAGRARPAAGIAPRGRFGRSPPNHPGGADLARAAAPCRPGAAHGAAFPSALHHVPPRCPGGGVCETTPPPLPPPPPARGDGSRVRDHRGAPHGRPFVPRLLPASPGHRRWAWGLFSFSFFALIRNPPPPSPQTPSQRLALTPGGGRSPGRGPPGA